MTGRTSEGDSAKDETPGKRPEPGERAGAEPDDRPWRLSGKALPRWRERLLLTSRPRHLLGGRVPAPFHDKPRRALLPTEIDDPEASIEPT